MPNLIERRRMKRRSITMSQQPVYNIYYTDAQAIPQLPNFSRNLLRTYPQLEQSIYPLQRLQDSFAIPQNNRNYIAADNNGQEYFNAPRSDENVKRTEKKPFFPEESQRRCKLALKNRSAETPRCLHPQPSSPKSCRGCKSSTERRDTCFVTTSESRGSCNRVNSNSPHITLPAQAIGSNHGYSMKIQVLTTPFKAKEVGEKKRSNGVESTSEFDNDSYFTKQEVPLELEDRQNRICPRTREARKRDSILSKLKRKMKKKRSRTIVDDPGDSSRSNSALEILSPRQLIESSTNVCSSIGNSQIEPENSSPVAINFEEALKNLEETLKIDTEPTELKKTSNHQFSGSSTPFVCEACKLKNHFYLRDRSSLGRVRNSSRSLHDHFQEVSHNSALPRNSIPPEETLDNRLLNVHCNKTRRDKQLFRDHSPPERDEPTRSLGKSTHSQGANHHNGACRHFPDSNLACCGLVMYGQEQPLFKSTKEQCCMKTIPVCGTVSQGLSPGFDKTAFPLRQFSNLPNFTLTS